MTDAEHVQRCDVVAAFAAQRIEQDVAALRAMWAVDRVLHLAPQRGLPVAVVLARVLLPVEDPIRSVNQVLRVEPRQILG